MYSRESSTQALRPFSFSLLAGTQHVNSSHVVSYSQFDGEPHCSYFTGVVGKVVLFFQFRHRVQTASADRDPGQESPGSRVSSPLITINPIWRNVVSLECYKSAASLRRVSFEREPAKGKSWHGDTFCVMNESATSLGVCVFLKLWQDSLLLLCYRWNNTPEVLQPQC